MPPKKDNNDPDTFQVPRHTVDKGRDYEKFSVVHFILTLLSNDEVKNFKISANAENYGAFDDVVLEIEKSDGTWVEYAIQLKHMVSDKRKISKENLITGKNSVKKYYETWKNDLKGRSCKLVLFTNVPNFFHEGESVPLDDVKPKVKKVDVDTLIDTSEDTAKDYCYQLHLEEEKEEYKGFFENFVILSNQIKSDRMKSNAARIFQETFECENDSSFENFCSVVGDWYGRVGKKRKIDKEWAQQIIAICLLFPQYIQPTSSSTQNQKCGLFEEAIANFDVTVVPEVFKKNVMTIWQNCSLSKSEFNEIKEQYNLGFMNFFYHDNDVKRSSKKSLALWLQGRCPLIVSEHPQVLKAIEISSLKNFVLISKDPDSVKLHNSFCNLLDLKTKNMDAYTKLIEHFEISVQGKNINLKSFLEHSEQLSTIITTEKIVSMLHDVFVVGRGEEELPTPYIPRKLSSTFIHIKYLQHVEREDQKVALVLSCEGKFDKIEKHIENLNPTKIEDLKNLKKLDCNTVLYFEEKCSRENFDEICKKYKSFKQLHHFRISDGGDLEWIKSKGTIEDLEAFQIEGPDIEESELFESLENSVNIICATPGMGKSIIAKSLKNHLSSKFWTIIITPSDVSTFFREGSSNFEEYILKRVCRHLKEFDIAVMESFKDKNLLAYIWDGLDEIYDRNFEQVLKIVEELSKKGFLQWITARIHLQERLERKFTVFARTVREFDDEQQDTYIRKRLGSAKKIKQTKEIVKKIKENFRLIKCEQTLGIPLQIYMLTELFVQDENKYTQLLENIFSITDLYQHFVNEKFNRFFREKAQVPINKANDSLKQVLESYTNSYIKKYEKAALRALFEDDFFEKFNINCKAFLEKIKTECDGFGLITEVSENMIPTFLHNSYSEYFVASYFHKNYEKIENLQDILFRKRYSNVRFLFDLLMAQGCPAHIAVLYKNIEVLKNNDDKIEKKDKGGRNPLQLACTWGEQHPLLNTKIIEEVQVIDNSLGESSIEETDKQKEIVEYLIEKCDHEEKDELFGMDSLSYADTALCLFPLFEISKEVEIDFNNFTNYRDLCTVVYYAIKFDKDHIITLIDKIPDFRTEARRLSLLHLCAEYNSVKCVKKLLSFEKYKLLVNALDKFEVPPTRAACKKGHTTVLEMFLENGADLSNILELFEVACRNDQNEVIEVLIKHGRNKDIEMKHNAVCSLMAVACRRNYYRVVRFLTEKGINSDIKMRNMAPIFIASQYNHIKTVEVLIERGADVNTFVKIGSRPLHIACQKNNLEIVRLLAGADKADINSLDNKGNTPLNVACKNKNEELVEFLLGLDGVDIHKMNKDKQESIHTACKNDNPRIVEMLIKSGAKTNSLCGKNRTPLHYACEGGHLEVVEVLCNHAARKDALDDKGETPLDLAQKGNFQEIVNFLNTLL